MEWLQKALIGQRCVVCLHQAMPLIALIAKVTVLPLADIDIFFAVIYLLVIVIFPLQCQRNSKSGSLHSNLLMSANCS